MNEAKSKGEEISDKQGHYNDTREITALTTCIVLEKITSNNSLVVKGDFARETTLFLSRCWTGYYYKLYFAI